MLRQNVAKSISSVFDWRRRTNDLFKVLQEISHDHNNEIFFLVSKCDFFFAFHKINTCKLKSVQWIAVMNCPKFVCFSEILILLHLTFNSTGCKWRRTKIIYHHSNQFCIFSVPNDFAWILRQFNVFCIYKRLFDRISSMKYEINANWKYIDFYSAEKKNVLKPGFCLI